MKTFSIVTYGCQMNISDSERVAAVCELMGYTQANSDTTADVYILNTCSIRQKAEDRVIGRGKMFYKLKKENPGIKVVLTGCMAKRDLRQTQEKSSRYEASYHAQLRKKMPWLDFIIPINEIHTLPTVLNEEVTEHISEYFAVTPSYNSAFQAYIPISTGCNKFCTFCIVPFTRGKEEYRSFEQVYAEVEQAIGQGFKEITLLGQNVNSWSDTNTLRSPITPLRSSTQGGNNRDFTFLMDQLASIPGDYWLRFTSSHPYDINLNLIDTIASRPAIAQSIHFALQSGSNSVLKRMNRYYTREEFKEKVEIIREKIPGVGLTTDVIVGFCGETEKEFQDTARLCEELRFDQIYISEYSQREGTIASKFYPDNVPLKVKAERKSVLDNILKQGVAKNNEQLIGSEQKALVYKTRSKNKAGIFAKTTHGKDVHIELDPEQGMIEPGSFVTVQVTGHSGFCLQGRLA